MGEQPAGHDLVRGVEARGRNRDPGYVERGAGRPDGGQARMGEVVKRGLAAQVDCRLPEGFRLRPHTAAEAGVHPEDGEVAHRLSTLR